MLAIYRRIAAAYNTVILPSVLTLSLRYILSVTLYKEDTEAFFKHSISISMILSKDNDFETTKRKRIEYMPKKAVDSTEATKSSIYEMMVNSIDYYNKASGTVIYGDGDFINHATVITFQTDMTTGSAYCNQRYYEHIDNIYSVTTEDLDENYIIQDIETYYDDGIYLKLDHDYKKYFKNIGDPVTPQLEKRVADAEIYSIGTDGLPRAVYRADYTRVPLASRCLFPQGFTMGALHDFSLWNIEEITELDGNECFRITGTPEESYAGKTRIHNYEMYVNTKNGCIMRLQGFNENGELVFYVYTDDLRFDDEAQEHKKAPSEIPEGYRKIGER